MSNRQCLNFESEHLRKFVAYLKHSVNAARYFPPVLGFRYMVALALYSKCITVAEATITLLDAGFNDEAFGMTRTLVDIFINLRYIANKETDERAQLFYQFFAKDTQVWGETIKKFWPEATQHVHPSIPSIAARYKSPHRWSGKPFKDMALEPDTLERAENGQPVIHDFAYYVVYRWTSHYEHPTIVALENHLVQAGHDNFVVRSKPDMGLRQEAIFNIAAYVSSTMVSFYRCMQEPQPQRVSRWSAALMSHLVRRHATVPGRR